MLFVLTVKAVTYITYFDNLFNKEKALFKMYFSIYSYKSKQFEFEYLNNYR